MFIATTGIRSIPTSVDIDRLRVLHTDALQRWRACVCGAITIGAGIIGLTFLQLLAGRFNDISLDSDSGA